MFDVSEQYLDSIASAQSTTVAVRALAPTKLFSLTVMQNDPIGGRKRQCRSQRHNYWLVVHVRRNRHGLTQMMMQQLDDSSTCALLRQHYQGSTELLDTLRRLLALLERAALELPLELPLGLPLGLPLTLQLGLPRSAQRRVGPERRPRRSPDHQQKKRQ